MPRLWLLLALVLSLLASACGSGEENGLSTPEVELRGERAGALSGILYARTPTHLVRFDLARRTAESRKLPDPQFGMFETAVVAGDQLVQASVSRTSAGALFGGEDEWIVTLHVLDGATGREQDRVALGPLRDVPPAPSDSQGCFCSVGSIRVWYVPETETVLVGIAAVREAGTRLFRLDVIDSEEWVQRRSIDLGDFPARNYGDIHVATDTAGNVAVLLTGSRESRLFVAPPDLSSLEVVGEPIADCSTVEAVSTHRSQTRYFLCLRPIPDTVLHEASMLAVDNANGTQRYELPGRLETLQGGIADVSNRVFIGMASVRTPTVLAFDLTTGEIIAEHQFEPVFSSSWGERIKRFIFGPPVFARTVVYEPIVASPDGSRVFFSNGYTLWCLQPDDLSVVGQLQLEGTETQVLAMTADGAHVIAAGVDKGIEIINGAQCRSEDSLDSPEDDPYQILVPE